MKVHLDILSTNFEFTTERLIVHSIDNDFFYIIDINDKLIDVSKMPSYIKNDYYSNKSKKLDITTFNEIIEKFKYSYSIQPTNIGNKLKINFILSEEDLSKINSIKRELKINEIIKKN